MATLINVGDNLLQFLGNISARRSVGSLSRRVLCEPHFLPHMVEGNSSARLLLNDYTGKRPTAGQADLRRLGLPPLTIAACFISYWTCLQIGVPPITRFAILQNLFPSISSGDRKTKDIQVLACNDAVIWRGVSVFKF